MSSDGNHMRSVDRVRSAKRRLLGPATGWFDWNLLLRKISLRSHLETKAKHQHQARNETDYSRDRQHGNK